MFHDIPFTHVMEPAHSTRSLLRQIQKQDTQAGVHRFDERCMQKEEEQTKLGGRGRAGIGGTACAAPPAPPEGWSACAQPGPPCECLQEQWRLRLRALRARPPAPAAEQGGIAASMSVWRQPAGLHVNMCARGATCEEANVRASAQQRPPCECLQERWRLHLRAVHARPRVPAAHNLWSLISFSYNATARILYFIFILAPTSLNCALYGQICRIRGHSLGTQHLLASNLI
eukprot:1159642-Pelagomonas_calceolata.AAC.1